MSFDIINTIMFKDIGQEFKVKDFLDVDLDKILTKVIEKNSENITLLH